MAQECPLRSKKLLFIDTGFNNPYCYDSLLTLAHSVGFNPLFKAFYNASKQDLLESDTIFFNIDGLFLKKLASEIYSLGTFFKKWAAEINSLCQFFKNFDFQNMQSI